MRWIAAGCLVAALALSPLLAEAATPAQDTATAHKHAVHKTHRASRHWHGYGFLPGYHQPPNNNVPVYGPKGATGGGAPRYAPSYYWYDGSHYYFGNPGFFDRRYNGGSFGPCWTWTPIGPIWNCG